MGEDFSKRVGRLVAGSFNAMVDAVEDSAPEMVMNQAIRDLDSAIEDVRAEKGKATAAKYLANKRLLEQNNKHSDLSEKIELAISQSRDDLAQAAISRQMDIEAQFPILENSIADAVEREQENEGFLTALLAKKREMLDEVKQFKAAVVGSVDNSTHIDTNEGAGSQKARNAMAAFDRILEKQTGLGGLDVKVNDAGKLAELEELARKNRIQERLAAFKSEESNL